VTVLLIISLFVSFFGLCIRVHASGVLALRHTKVVCETANLPIREIGSTVITSARRCMIREGRVWGSGRAFRGTNSSRMWKWDLGLPPPLSPGANNHGVALAVWASVALLCLLFQGCSHPTISDRSCRQWQADSIQALYYVCTAWRGNLAAAAWPVKQSLLCCDNGLCWGNRVSA
jgi:hypothetical protein